MRSGRFSVAPVFDVRAAALVGFDSVRLHLTHLDGTAALDTTLFFPANVDTLTLDLHVPVTALTQQFLLSLVLVDSTGATVFTAGPDTVTASAGSPAPPVHPPLTYVGPGSHAAGVRFLGATPSSAYFQDTVTYVAEAFDSQGVTLPKTPIYWTSSDTLKARVLNKGAGVVVAGVQRGSATITASLLTSPPPVTHTLTVQPKASAIAIQAGDGQNAAVGQPEGQQIVARVKALDGLGVQGIPVTFTPASGSVSKTVDTTDANGDARTTWTLGPSLGAQSLTASAQNVNPASVQFAANAIAAAAKKLVFSVAPSNVNPGASITPAVVVTAQDTFGNTATSFSGATAPVTVALAANPGGATLSGTTTVNAVNGVATFNNLSLNVADTGYTLKATSGTLTSVTSGAFAVNSTLPASLVITTQPTSTTAQTTMQAVQVTVKDAQGNVVTSDTATITAAISNNPASGTLSGTLAVKAVAGVATFSNLQIDKAGTGYTLSFTRAGVTPAISNSFNINTGPAAALKFSVQPPTSANFQSAFTTAVQTVDAGGNPVTSFSGFVTVGLGSNPAGGTLFGTVTIGLSSGVATFTTLDVDNIGSGYTLTASTGGLTAATSNAFNVVAPPGVNAWINTAGGNWGTASNWSKGTVPSPTDTVAIAQSGNYTVNLDVNASPVALGVGAPLGSQVLLVAANVLTLSTTNVFTPTGKLSLAGGTIAGTGALTLQGGMDWTGGILNGSGGSIDVVAGTLTISGSAARSIQNFTLRTDVAATLTGAQTISTGSAGTVRVGPTGTLDIQGADTLLYNLGGTPTVLDVLAGGTVLRSTSSTPALVSMAVNNAGTVSVGTGTLSLQGGGTSSGVFTAGSGATLQFSGGTQSTTGTMNGAGALLVSGGTLNVGGPYSASTTAVTGGTLNINSFSNLTGALNFSGGTIGGSGSMGVSGALSWTGGNFNGSAGILTANGTLAISTAAARSMQNFILQVAGTGTWTGNAIISSGSSAILNVLNGGSFDIQGDDSLLYNLGGAPSTLQVSAGGTLTRSTSTGSAAITANPLVNGTLTVSSGTLRLGGNTAVASGTYTVASGATLDFYNGVQTFGGNVGGAGTILISGATFSPNGGYNVTGTTQVNSGTINYGGTGGTLANLNFTGGVIGGSGTWAVTGAMSWTGGSFNGSAGTLTVNSGATLAITGANARTMQSYTLANAGTGTWTGTGSVSTGSAAALTVLGGGTLDVQGDPSFQYNLGGAPSSFNVAASGTVTRSTSANPFLVTAPFNNTGTVTITSGAINLNLSAAGTSTGTFTIGAADSLMISNGTETLGAGSSVSGGTVAVSGGTLVVGNAYSVPTTRVTGSGTLTFNSAGSPTTGQLDFQNGTIGGTSVFTVSSTLSWTGGNFNSGNGTTRLLASATGTIGGTTGRNMQAYNLEIAGTANWSGTHIIQTGSGAIMRVLTGGILNITADPTINYTLGGAPTLFDNLGTVNRNTSSGIANISTPFNNAGVTNVTTGFLQINGGGTLASTIALTSPGSLLISGGNWTMNPGLQITGNGAVTSFTSGTLAGLPGVTDTAKISNLQLNGGALANTVGTVLATQSATWNSGSMSGGGKLLIPSGSALVIAGTAGRNIQNYTIENASTSAAFTGAMIVSSGSGAVIRNLPTGTLTVSAASTFSYNLGGATSIFDNQGTLQVAPGAGAAFGVGSAFNNSGTVNVTVGTLNLTGGGAETGSASLSAGTFLDFNGGTHTLSNSVNVTGAGTARVQSGTITTPTATDTARFVNLQLNSGSLTQPGGIIASGTLDWAGAVNLTGTGTTAGSNIITLTGTAGRNFQNGIFENRGSATWSGTFILSSGSGATMLNDAGKSFVLSGDGTFSFNLGGAASQFVNKGTFTRNTSVNLAAWNSNYIDTTGTTSITSGGLSLSGTTRIAGAPVVNTGDSLVQGGGTMTFKAGTSFSGGGIVALNSGSFSIDSGSTAVALQNLDLNGSAVAHEGLLTVSGIFNWVSGNLTSNTNGLGGTTRVLATGNMNFSGAAGRTFSGTHLLELLGTNNTWTANVQLSTGNGAIMRVQTGATLNVTATAPTYNFNQGGAAPTFNNLGTVNRNTGTSGWVVNLPVTGNGAWNVGSPSTLDVQCGGGVNTCSFTGPTTVASGATLQQNAGIVTYSSASSITGAGLIQVNAGTFNAQGPITIGTLVVGSGSGIFNMGGNTVNVTGNFSTSGSGVFNETTAANNDSLNVTGNVTFGGALGTTNAGVIRLSGNWSQTGTANFKGTALSATVAHRVRFAGGNTTVSFADPVNAFFRRMLVSMNAGTALTLNTDVKTTFVSLGGGTYSVKGIASPMSHLTADTIAGATGGSNSFAQPLVLVANVDNIEDSSNISVDTLVFAGSGQTIRTTNPVGFGSYTLHSVRIMDSVTVSVPGPFSIPNDLVIASAAASGRLEAAPNSTMTIGGKLKTQGSGALRMTNLSNVSVTDSAIFAGGNETGRLTSGTLSLAGHFVQSTNSTAFVASGTHTTTFNGAGTQSISFANPTTSFFNGLTISKSGAARFLTDAVINNGLTMPGGASPDTLKGPAAHIKVAGGILSMTQSTASPVLDSISSVELVAAPNIGGSPTLFAPDTTIYSGTLTMPFQSTSIAYQSIRISGSVTLAASSTLVATKDFVVDGAGSTITIQGQVDSILGNLTTRNSGTFNMTGGTFIVGGNATFSGGTSAFSGGQLNLKGNFTQNTNATAFQGTSGHITAFVGAATTQTVNFANPAASGASNFGNLFIGRTVAGSSAATGITLASNIFIAGTLQDTAATAVDSIAGAGFTVTAAAGVRQIVGGNLVLNNALLSLTNFTTFTVHALAFNNMNPASTYLTMTRNSSGADSPTGIHFNTAVTTGKYFNFTGTASYTWSVTSALPAAGSMTGNYVRGGTTPPTITWNGTTLP